MAVKRIWFDVTKQGKSVYVNDEKPGKDDRYPGGKLSFIDVEIPGLVQGDGIDRFDDDVHPKAQEVA